MPGAQAADVLTVGETGTASLQPVLGRYGLTLHLQPIGAALPGSFWGAPEAGIVGLQVHVNQDTPLHSFLHETSHIVCMAPALRAVHAGDAGSDDLEEAAVCYLQIVLADDIPKLGRERIMDDMDAWGYSFRLGSTRRWFHEDADDARAWLRRHGLIDAGDRPTYRLREADEGPLRGFAV